jgi:hypothetical protein
LLTVICVVNDTFWLLGVSHQTIMRDVALEPHLAAAYSGAKLVNTARQ